MSEAGTKTDSGTEALDRYQRAMEERVGVVDERSLGVIDARMIARYALAIGETDPIHRDPEAARAAGHADIVAPPNMLSAIHEWDEGLDESAMEPDGTHRGSDTGALRVMGAGERLELIAPVVAGTALVSRRSVERVERKAGKSGPLLFVTLLVEFSDDQGRLLNRNHRTVMARP